MDKLDQVLTKFWSMVEISDIIKLNPEDELAIFNYDKNVGKWIISIKNTFDQAPHSRFQQLEKIFKCDPQFWGSYTEFNSYREEG